LFTGTASERVLSDRRTDFADGYCSANSLDRRPDTVWTLLVRITPDPGNTVCQQKVLFVRNARLANEVRPEEAARTPDPALQSMMRPEVAATVLWQNN
jgi:hypothetical protein